MKTLKDWWNDDEKEPACIWDYLCAAAMFTAGVVTGWLVWG
jgi:hypothetical protein